MSKNPLKQILWTLFFLIFILSLIAFFLPLTKAFLPIFQSSNSTYSYSIQKILRVSAFTFVQAFVSMLIAVLVALPAAYFLANKKFFGQKFLYSLGSVPLCIPPLIVVLGYISTFGMNGFFNRLLMGLFHLEDSPLTFLYSFWGIVLVQGFYNFPLVMVTVADFWRTLDSSQSDSAKLLGASGIKVFFTITLPQIFPSIVTSCIPVFLYSFFSFMIVLLFGAPGTSTLELEIYHAGRSSLDFTSVARLSSIETLIALTTIFIWTFVEKKLHRNHLVTFCQDNRTKIKGKQKLVFAFYFMILAIFFLFPLLSILFGSLVSKSGGANHFSINGWIRVFKMKDFLPSLKNTLWIASCTSILCTVCGFFYSSILRVSRQSSFTPFLNSIVLLPMAVSSVTIGLGMSSIFRNSSPVILIASQTCLSWPFAFRQIFAQMSKIPQPVLDSASILSKNPLDKIFKIILPYSWRGIISAAGFCFAISAGDATLPLVLSLQKFTTLSLFTYRLAGSYRFTEACVSGLLLGIICSLVFGFSKRIGNGKTFMEK